MSLEKVKNDLLSGADAEAQTLERQADEDTRQILAAAHAEAKKKIDELRQLGEEEAKRKDAELSAAKMKANKILAESREAAVRAVLDGVRSELHALAKSPAYPTALEKLAKQALKEIGSGAVLTGRAADAKLLAKLAPVADAPIETMGGCVALSADGRLWANNTFEALLEENEAELKEKIFRELFGGAKRKAGSETSEAKSVEKTKKPVVRLPHTPAKSMKAAPKKAAKKKTNKGRK